MNAKLYLLAASTIILITTSCKTASKLYEKGNYDEAVQLAAKKLKKDPNDVKLQSLIKDAYHYAVNDHENNIHDISIGRNELMWEQLYNQYVSLQKLHDAIASVPTVDALVQPTDYTSFINTYAEKAGDERLSRALSLMNKNDKQSFRAAYNELKIANRFIPNDQEIMDKMDEAYEYAVTNVVVQPIQQQGGFVYSSYTIGGYNLDDKILNDLKYQSGNGFVKFYNAWDARSQRVRVDKFLDMQLLQMQPSRQQETKSTEKLSKNILVKEIVYRPDSVVKVYEKVTANFTTTTRTHYTEAMLQINVLNENGGWLWAENFPASHQWTNTFYNYKGDIRALNDNEAELLNRKVNNEPLQESIYNNLLDQISSNAVNRLSAFFRNQ